MLLAILTASLIYTLLVFSGGFLCGIIRVPILEPWLGERYAQLLEMPLMIVVIWRSAKLVVSRMNARLARDSRGGIREDGYLAVGVLALVWFLVVEIGLYRWVHRGEGKGWRDWVWERDLVSGAGFFAVLGGFMVLPGMLA